MKKISVIILLIVLSTAMVFSVALHSNAGSSCCAKVCKNQKITASVKAKPDTNKKGFAEIKTECKKESKSFFANLFTFDMPKFPLEDVFLAAQKALFEKLF